MNNITDAYYISDIEKKVVFNWKKHFNKVDCIFATAHQNGRFCVAIRCMPNAFKFNLVLRRSIFRLIFFTK